MVTKEELLEMVNQIPDGSEVTVDCCMEVGRGISGDSDSHVYVEEEEDGKWIVHVSGDEDCDTGYYD